MWFRKWRSNGGKSDKITSSEKSHKNWLSYYLNSQTLMVLNRIRLGAISAFLLNWVLTFTTLYSHFLTHNVLKTEPFIFLVLRPMRHIKAEMLLAGDDILYANYFAFSLINAAILVTAILISVSIPFNYKECDHNKKGVIHPGSLCLIVIFLVAPIQLNDVGYGNIRFPMSSAIGHGEIFFIRDSILYLLIAASLVELSIITKIRIKMRRFP